MIYKDLWEGSKSLSKSNFMKNWNVEHINYFCQSEKMIYWIRRNISLAWFYNLSETGPVKSKGKKIINNNNRKSNSNVCTIDYLIFFTIIQRINQNIHIKIF